ncbi:hypothetical protein ACLI4Y_15525 [Natrialbaceae archaeon A-CW3]
MSATGSAVFAFALAVALAAVHLVADRIPFSWPLTRARWLSAAAGVSIVYVLIYILPKLAHEHAQVTDTVSGGGRLIYVLVFCGLAGFFGLERIARVTKTRRPTIGPNWITRDPVFWIHIAVFAAYNGVIGYVLVSGELLEDPIPFAIAMGLHLFGIDEGLRNHHNDVYHRFGRWVLAGALLVGAVGVFVSTLGTSTQIWLLALLSGGILFNAIKEELPADRESSFWAFVVGAGLFAGIVALLL